MLLLILSSTVFIYLNFYLSKNLFFSGIEPNRIADSGQNEVTQQAVEQYPNQSSNSFNSTEGAGGTQQTSDSSNQQRLPQAEPPIQISQTSHPAQQQQPEKWNYLDPSGVCNYFRDEIP